MSDKSPAAAPTREQIATWREMLGREALHAEVLDAHCRRRGDDFSADGWLSRASHWRALDALLEQLAARVDRDGRETEVHDGNV